MRVVVLFSGGIDSYAGYLLAKRTYGYEHTITPVYIDYKGKGCNKEKAIAKSLVPETVIIDGVFDFTGKEEGDEAFLYARNLYFTTFVSRFADMIYLCGLKNSEMLDNTKEFYQTATKVLSQIKGSLVQVTSPFIHMEKEEVVDMLFNDFGKETAITAITKTTSCHDPDEDWCWNCPNCFYFLCAVWEYRDKLPYEMRFDNKEILKYYYQKSLDFKLPPVRTKTIKEIYHYFMDN